ncbi:hypothetical protein ILUMI_13422 [Ignelater luminosus]|uniref:LIM zinc-binding domain-containing protein n=1 Tax=Ignelater luminosus TaxID=2038154 RepID=A0A8K0CWS3_IGNLU|nr:hypothetical protein ILUMI_13422 [Ignelater luminosus]
MHVSVHGFKTSGVIPVNRNVYADVDVAAEALRHHMSTPITPQPTVVDPNLRISLEDIWFCPKLEVPAISNRQRDATVITSARCRCLHDFVSDGYQLAEVDSVAAGEEHHLYLEWHLLEAEDWMIGLIDCAACDERIRDKFLLKVSGRSWHARCLRCCVCQQQLDRQPSCFIRNKAIYCKADYAKSFGAKCSVFSRGISSSDWVRKACEHLETPHGGTTSSDDGCNAKGFHKNKAKRVRITFTEEPLQVVQANFQLDSNPDGQDLERIAQITGLNKRVAQGKEKNLEELSSALIYMVSNLQSNLAEVTLFVSNYMRNEHKNPITRRNLSQRCIVHKMANDFFADPTQEDLSFLMKLRNINIIQSTPPPGIEVNRKKTLNKAKQMVAFHRTQLGRFYATPCM